MPMNAPVPADTKDRIVRGKRLPGRRPEAELAAYDLGTETLADAHAILDAIESGRLTKQYPAPLSATSTTVAGARKRPKGDEEAELFRAAKAGSIDARNRLITANMGLIHLVAKQFKRLGEARYEDLVAEGILGIARAIETFEPKRGHRFSTYAIHWIRAKVRRAFDKMLRDDEPAVPVTDKNQGDHYFIADDGRKIRRRAFAQSMDEVVHAVEGGDATFGDGLASEGESPEDAVLRNEVAVEVRRHVDEVVADEYARTDRTRADRARKIMFERMYVDDSSSGHPSGAHAVVTLQELGEATGLSREGIRLVESRLKRVLRRRLASYAPADATATVEATPR